MRYLKTPLEEVDKEELAFLARGYLKACLDVYGGTLQPRVRTYLSKSVKYLNILLVEYDDKIENGEDNI